MKDRVKSLNLLNIHMPVTAWISIGHRISGLLLSLGLLWALYTLFFLRVCNVYSWNWLIRQPVWIVSATITVSAFIFHFLAGLRHIYEDHSVGHPLESSMLSAKLTIAGWLFLTLLFTLFLVL